MPKRRRRRSRRSSRSENNTHDSRSKRLVWNSVRKVYSLCFESSFLLCLPVIFLFIFSSTDFLLLLNFTDAPIVNVLHTDDGFFVEDEGLRNNAELIKQQYKFYIIGIIILFTLGNAQKVAYFFSNNFNVVVLFLVLLSGYFLSIEPSRVFSNVVNILISLLACVLFVIGQKKPDRLFHNTLLIVFVCTGVVVAGSFVLLIEMGIDGLQLLSTDKRFGGLAGNPNALGILCALGIWTSTSLIFDGHSRLFLKSLAIVMLGVFTYLLVLSGSATALLISIIGTAGVIWGYVLNKVSAAKSLTLNLTLIFAVLAGATVFVSFFTGESFLFVFTESMGKDTSLTGRTEMWEIAMAAISERPFFGWSFDSHTSVFANPDYWIPLNQYHNGFLDTMVAGGILLIAALAYHLYRFVVLGFRLNKYNNNITFIMLPFLFLLLHNFSEYSILRINSMLWQVYLLCYASLALYPFVHKKHRERHNYD